MMKRICFKFFIFTSLLQSSVAVAEESVPAINFKNNDGYLIMEVPVDSISSSQKDLIEIFAKGAIDSPTLHAEFKIKPNKLPPREGITLTEQACQIILDESLFKEFAKRLDLPVPSGKFHPATFNVVVAEGDLAEIQNSPVKLELVYLEADDLYSEWYLEIDAPNKKVALSEKNNQYREPFVAAFFK